MKTSALLLLLILASTLSSDVLALYFRTLAAPILQHTGTGTNATFYSIVVNRGEKYIIDFEAAFTWFKCPPQSYYSPIECVERACSTARSYIPPSCAVNNTYNEYKQCFCNDAPVNPITKSCAPSQATAKDINIDWTDGRSPIISMNFNSLYMSCAPPSLLQNFPEEVIGVVALSRSSLSLVYQITGQLGFFVAKKFALCLPSSSEARGVIYIGDFPYFLKPRTDFDAARILTHYAPLEGNAGSLGYYINVTGISINGKAMNVPRNAFNFNQSVKLSTFVPYTTVKSNIYKAFIGDFKKAAKGIVQVSSVHPFGLCFTIGSSMNASLIPQIDLMLGNGHKWTIYPSNSVKQVNDKVACLAFVDGGETAKQAVIIGAYQMVDNLLEFDLEQSRLAFSSSLLRYGATCGGFNFPVGGTV